MNSLLGSFDETLSSVERLRGSLAKSTTKQVSAREERSLVKATCLAWFNAHRSKLALLHGDTLFKTIDGVFGNLLESSDRATSRSRYKNDLKALKGNLVRLRSQAVLLPDVPDKVPHTSPAPDFSKLISDPRMQDILLRRWTETQKCLSAGAYLAATVMMGSLLEALLLARVNGLIDKAPVFSSKCAPKNPKTGKTQPLQEWTLNSYIDVAHDLGWIRGSGRDVSKVLRDYRNFVHPEKEFTHRIVIEQGDAQMFWAIFTQLSEQIVNP